MSGVPTELEFGESPDPGPSGRRLSISATAYLVAISAIAFFAAMPFVPRLQTEQHSVTVWLTFVLFAVGAAIAQVALVKTPRNQSYHATNVFLIPAILLLPPELVVVIAVVQHIPAWLKNRTAWYRRVLQHLQLRHRDAGGVGDGPARATGRRADSQQRPTLRCRGSGLLARPRRAEPRDARPDAAPRPRALDP